MTEARIIEKPKRFARVDEVKKYVGQEILDDDHRFWILGDPMLAEADGQSIEVPTGFTTDGASVPGWAQALTAWGPWEEPQRWGGILHDWMYSTKGVRKSHSDRVFRAVLKSEDANWLKRKLMYAAVVVGGGPAYKRNQARGPRIFV